LNPLRLRNHGALADEPRIQLGINSKFGNFFKPCRRGMTGTLGSSFADSFQRPGFLQSNVYIEFDSQPFKSGLEVNFENFHYQIDSVSMFATCAKTPPSIPAPQKR
jgi:hypothetical protein